MSAIQERERWTAEMQEQQREFRRALSKGAEAIAAREKAVLDWQDRCHELHCEIWERDRRDAELREALELYKGHELKLERLVRELFRWATGEGPKAPIAPDREAQVQREAEEFYGGGG